MEVMERKMDESIQESKFNRILSIDRLRGFAVFVMVFFQLAENFDNFKILSKISTHSPNSEAIYLLPNFALADINVSVFLLAIGLTYAMSFNKRTQRDGQRKAIFHLARRYISIVGLGILLYGIDAILGGKFTVYTIVVAAISSIMLISYIVAGISKKLNNEKISAVFKRTAQTGFIVLGIIGILVAALNFVLLCIGKTNTSFRYWGTLEHIGLAGLIVLPFIAVPKRNSTAKKFLAGFIILLLYGAFHQTDLSTDLFPNNMLLLDVVADGGFFAGFAWGAQMLIFMGFADLYYKSRKTYVEGTAIFTIPVTIVVIEVIGKVPEGLASWSGVCNSFLPINKGSVSPAYIILTTWICLLIFLVFDFFNKFKINFDFLSWWGQNPMTMYIMEFVFVGGLVMIFEGHFSTVPAVIGFLECIAIMSVMTFIAYKLVSGQKIYRF